MAREVFSMYCGLHYIDGMLEEKKHCEAIFRSVDVAMRALFLMRLNGLDDWVYGQCNFVLDPDGGHTSPFKFSNTVDNLIAENVVTGLIEQAGVRAVLFSEPDLMARIAAYDSVKPYRALFNLVDGSRMTPATATATPGAATSPQKEPVSLFSRLFGRR
jgi:hypothetical protein